MCIRLACLRECVGVGMVCINYWGCIDSRDRLIFHKKTSTPTASSGMPDSGQTVIGLGSGSRFAASLRGIEPNQYRSVHLRKGVAPTSPL
jgi:hypothetical protein